MGLYTLTVKNIIAISTVYKKNEWDAKLCPFVRLLLKQIKLACVRECTVKITCNMSTTFRWKSSLAVPENIYWDLGH